MSNKRPRTNYPPKQPGYSCHHPAYRYDLYNGELEKIRYQHNEAMLLPVRNERHNLGSLSLHALIDPVYGEPPKPRRPLMEDAVNYMESLDRSESRIRRFGSVISFFMDEAEENPSYYSAQQADLIAKHYQMQYQIITEGGEAFIRSQQYLRQRELAR